MENTGNEVKFSAWLRERLPGHVIRIENTIGAGIPDINWCNPDGVEVWIETKIWRNGVKLEKEQYAWGMRRERNNGKVRVVCLKENTILVYFFPFIVKQAGKYVSIVSNANYEINKKDFVNSLLM